MTVPRPPIRVAVLGAGAIAQVVHLPILSRMRGVELAAVSDRDAHTARTVAARYGARALKADDVFNDPSVQAVVVCTPSARHEENVREALEAGKFVLCEKPLALSPQAVEGLLKVDGAADRLLVAMNQRFRPDVRALRSFVTSGELGDVFYLKTGWLNRAKPVGRSWRERRAAGGGALMELGIQMLDVALWILGYPRALRVSAHTHRAPGAEVEDSAALLLRLEGNRLVNVTPNLPSGSENPFTASYRNELQHFVETVRGERRAEAPAEHVQLMRVMEAAYRSAEEGREIEL